jgi:hypothetical protein
LDLGTQLEVYDEKLFKEYLEYPKNASLAFFT